MGTSFISATEGAEHKNAATSFDISQVIPCIDSWDGSCFTDKLLQRVETKNFRAVSARVSALPKKVRRKSAGASQRDTRPRTDVNNVAQNGKVFVIRAFQVAAGKSRLAHDRSA